MARQAAQRLKMIGGDGQQPLQLVARRFDTVGSHAGIGQAQAQLRIVLLVLQRIAQTGDLLLEIFNLRIAIGSVAPDGCHLIVA